MEILYIQEFLAPTNKLIKNIERAHDIVITQQSDMKQHEDGESLWRPKNDRPICRIKPQSGE